MYQNLFRGVPTKPVLVIAPLVIALALFLYYRTEYTQCTDHAALREQLYIHLKENIDQTISLAETTPFKWDKAVVLLGYKPDKKVRGCPFGWDWSKKHRDTLVEQGLLNIILYTLNKKRVNYVEFSREQIDFENTDTPLTPETSIFTVEAKDKSKQGLLLQRVVAQ